VALDTVEKECFCAGSYSKSNQHIDPFRVSCLTTKVTLENARLNNKMIEEHSGIELSAGCWHHANKEGCGLML
jgi:hypothetical protein